MGAGSRGFGRWSPDGRGLAGRAVFGGGCVVKTETPPKSVRLRIIHEKIPGCSRVDDRIIEVRAEAYPGRLADIACVGGGLCGLGEPQVDGDRVTIESDHGVYVVRVVPA